jgi:hypothetical protein
MKKKYLNKTDVNEYFNRSDDVQSGKWFRSKSTLMSREMLQTVIFLACVWKVPGSTFEWDTNYPEDFCGFIVASGKMPGFVL